MIKWCEKKKSPPLPLPLPLALPLPPLPSFPHRKEENEGRFFRITSVSSCELDLLGQQTWKISKVTRDLLNPLLPNH